MSNYYKQHLEFLVEKQKNQIDSEAEIHSYFPVCLQSTVKYLSKSYKNIMSCRGRLMKELKNLESINFKLPGIEIISTDNLHLLFADFNFKDHKIYSEENLFRLKIMFTENYPFSPPVCMFIKEEQDGIDKIPINPHIYSNGHICLDLLGPSWTPVHNVESLVISIQSMLSGNEVNERPIGDAEYVKRAPKDPSKTKFDYDDDDV